MVKGSEDIYLNSSRIPPSNGDFNSLLKNKVIKYGGRLSKDFKSSKEK